MPGRKNPRPTENEREHEYVMHQKIEGGEKLAGAGAEWLDEAGAVGEVEREREAWQMDRDERLHEQKDRRQKR